MININYLMPILVNYNNKQYISFIDFARDNVYFLENLDESIKQELSKLILLKINNDNIKDIKSFDINSDNKISKIINDIKNDSIIKKYSNPLEDEKNE